MKKYTYRLIQYRRVTDGQTDRNAIVNTARNIAARCNDIGQETLMSEILYVNKISFQTNKPPVAGPVALGPPVEPVSPFEPVITQTFHIIILPIAVRVTGRVNSIIMHHVRCDVS